MFDVSVSASTTNLGSGFDIFGLALDLKNVFRFEISEEVSFSGFLPIYNNQNNLVYKSYLTVFKSLAKESIPIKISLIKNDIPLSRGLGSSSSCIIAGVVAANFILGEPLSKTECLKLMVDLEGHPDNVTASYIGGLTTAFVDEEKVFYTKSFPSSKLRFVALIPDFLVSTQEARKVLKPGYNIHEIVYSMSRAVHLKDAFLDGNLEIIKSVLKDKIHEPYRIKLVKDGLLIKTEVESLGYAFYISGSGSTLMVVMKDTDDISKLYKIHLLDGWRILPLEIDYEGTKIIEVK